MKYMGSKNRISKYILPIILENRKSNQYYVEPFCGGCNLIDKIGGRRIATDSNKYLIALWKELQKGWVPKDLYTKEEYYYIKENKYICDYLTGYIGVCCSYSGKWFSGYSGITKTRNGIRYYQTEAKSNVLKQITKLSDVNFKTCSYDKLCIPENSLIYCDPPYQDTTKYKGCQNFDHGKFWSWCRSMKNKGHDIFISEYSAPNEFVCVWEKEVSSSLSANGKYGKNKRSTEKLFTLK